MLKKFLCAIAVMVAAQGPLVQAQQQVKVIYPDGSVRYEAAAPAAAPSGATTVSGVSCCPCNGGTGTCTPACEKGKNAPKVESKCPPGSTTCKDIPVVVAGDLVTTTVEELFYVECKPNEAVVPVPAIEIKKTELCEFKKHTYKVDCCEITVCVPCRTCKTESKKCVISSGKHKLRVCLRRDGTYDVYVLDVPGMPKEWLLYMEATKVQIETDLGITI